MLLLKNAFIVDSERTGKANVYVEDGKISYVGKEVNGFKRGEVIDCSGRIIIPAFFNTHSHIAMTFLRNSEEDLPLHEWLEKVIMKEVEVNEELLYYSSLLSLADCVRSGVVAINDMYWKGLKEIANACKLLGLKAVISYGMFEKFSSPKEELSKTLSWIRECEGYGENIKAGVACHAIYSCSEELIVKAFEISREKGLLFHMHVAETREELFFSLKEKGKRPVEYLESLGVLGENTVFAHSSWVTKREIKLLSSSKAALSHNPISNLKLATGGIMPFEEFLRQGALLTLGSDGVASSNIIDFFEVMKVASLLQKHKYWRANFGKAREIFRAATSNGAKALSFNSGFIREGFEADLVVLNPKENMVPFGDYYTSIVHSSKRDNVEKVFINGERVFDLTSPNFVNGFRERIFEEIEKAKKKLGVFS